MYLPKIAQFYKPPPCIFFNAEMVAVPKDLHAKATIQLSGNPSHDYLEFALKFPASFSFSFMPSTGLSA